MVEAFSTIDTGENLEDWMSQEHRLELVARGTVEIIQPAELERVLEEKKKPRAYWGFECSGKQP
jgi:tyrosyl-tRNA synthetase